MLKKKREEVTHVWGLIDRQRTTEVGESSNPGETKAAPSGVSNAIIWNTDRFFLSHTTHPTRHSRRRPQASHRHQPYKTSKKKKSDFQLVTGAITLSKK
jgi:hypothetical protein